MDRNLAEIFYLYHSGFAIRIRNCLLIFDYYLDICEFGHKGMDKGTISHEDLKNVDSVYVFVSHSHDDHYNPIVFDWQKVNSNIHYFLSFEVEPPTRDLRYHNMYPYEEYKDDTISVKTYGSTDLGVSFLVEIDGLRIFHAGDLNCWYWYYESTPEELEEDEGKFLKEMEKIRGETIDIAFFPVDPRLEEYYYMGGEYFIKIFSPKLFIPMHFGRKYGIIDAFAEKVKELPTEIARLSHRGQKIIYDEGRFLS